MRRIKEHQCDFSASNSEPPVPLQRMRKFTRFQQEHGSDMEKCDHSAKNINSANNNLPLNLNVPNSRSLVNRAIETIQKRKFLNSNYNNRSSFKAARCSSMPRQSQNISCETCDSLPFPGRSLSSSRYEQESNDSRKSSYSRHEVQEPIAFNPRTASSTSQFERNLKRFHAERSKIALEKRKFREKQKFTRMQSTTLCSLERNKNCVVPIEEKCVADLNMRQILLERFIQSQQHNDGLSRIGSFDKIKQENIKAVPDYESSTTSLSSVEISEIHGSGAQVGEEWQQSTQAYITCRKICLNNCSTIQPAITKESPDLNKKQQKTHTDSNCSIIKLLCQLFFVDSRYEWKYLKDCYPNIFNRMLSESAKCWSQFMILIMICGFGGISFRFLEGQLESSYKCGLGKVKRDFIDNLWIQSHDLSEDDWKAEARLKLRKFEEELHLAHEIGITSYSGSRSWSFVNSFIYCWTVVTTIGYGHISPTTVVGRAVTIVYAIIGIPMFLILLADFGKLFTRGIKFLWVFVRRMYYTGTFRKIRKHHNVQQMVHGMNIVYEIALRRPTLANIHVNAPEKLTTLSKDPGTPLSRSEALGSVTETPVSPVPEAFSIDDEFNLPISVAIIILLLYIFVGAAIYCIWEEWTYFESIYFVFISMSTIGFGDFVPQHPIFMMCSIAYLIFGLALTSMCINVVQVKLSDSFKQASVKIGATIGFEMSGEEDVSTQYQTPRPTSPTLEKQLTVTFPHQSTSVILSDSPPPLPRRYSAK